MEKNDAKYIATCLSQYGMERTGSFQLENMSHDSPLGNFHHWAEGKSAQGAFLFRRRSDGLAHWLSLIEWNPAHGYYLVVFSEDRSGPLAEIHRLETSASGTTLVWKYRPTKHDEYNENRKEYFERYFSATEVVISCPASTLDVDDFLEEIFSFVECRVKSDLLDHDTPPGIRESFPEGKRMETLHTRRERNSALINRAKQMAKSLHGRLFCQCCGFDFERAYGSLGADYIEAHHTKPLSELSEDGGETRLEDLALVCSNCHRMLHRRRPWLTMSELGELLQAYPSTSPDVPISHQ